MHAGLVGVASRLAALFGAAQAPASLLAGVSNAAQASPTNARRGATFAELLGARRHASCRTARIDDLAVAIARALIRGEDVAFRRVTEKRARRFDDIVVGVFRIPFGDGEEPLSVTSFSGVAGGLRPIGSAAELSATAVGTHVARRAIGPIDARVAGDAAPGGFAPGNDLARCVEGRPTRRTCRATVLRLVVATVLGGAKARSVGGA